MTDPTKALPDPEYLGFPSIDERIRHGRELRTTTANGLTRHAATRPTQPDRRRR